MKRPPELNADDWVDQYGDALFQYARARVQDHAIAEDLVQDAFLAAVQSKQRYQGKSTVKTWLFGILKHKIVDHYRVNKNTIRYQDIIDSDEPMDAFFNATGHWRIQPENWRADPGKAHANKEFLDHFYRCLSGLPRRTADVFLNREIEGRRTDEISKHHGITENNCWVILYRARMLLRKCLERAGMQPGAEGRGQ